MSDLQTQLDLLRQRVARINSKYSEAPQRGNEPAESRYGVEEWLDGEEVETPGGHHFVTCRRWEPHRRHGSMDIATLSELPDDLLEAVSEGTIGAAPPSRWCFLDTETTGLAGGTGTYAFLIGVGYLDGGAFRVKQYFLREPGEEASALEALNEQLAQFDVIVTYNGKSFDLPLLETRFRMARMRPPFDRMGHLDLLHGARRLWKLRFDNCRLMELENQILGVEREGDVPGELIPYLYFDYLRKGEILRLVPVFHHNAIDVLTLACLTAIVPYAFRDPREARLVHGAEMMGLARWLQKAGRLEEALAWMRQALERRLPDALLFRAMWDVAQLERKLGREHASLAMYVELAASRNPHQVQALEELAKHYEHRERNHSMALEFTRQALALNDGAELRHRKARLERKLAPRLAPRLL
ncbi:MAG: ribonuclease H-like domain-containing protein [Bryobacteraceae bacterium]|nr:ribonuclease H-like domain-containing protein [Bryobacteraceae bacterium]